mgnify:CR=1 FL=1
MKEIIKNETLGEIVYEEKLSGKKFLTIDGTPIAEVQKNTFKLGTGEYAILSGSYFTGVKLKIGNETIVLSKPLKWYEWIFPAFTVIFALIWGNVPQLCMIFPIVGGAIGGGVSMAGAIVSALCIKKADGVLSKLLIGVGGFFLTILVLFLLALLFIALLQGIATQIQ